MKRSLLALLPCALAFAAAADEGMWLYNQPPRQLLRERHQFDASDAWLEHLLAAGEQDDTRRGVALRSLLQSGLEFGASDIERAAAESPSLAEFVQTIRVLGAAAPAPMSNEDVENALLMKVKQAAATTRERGTTATIEVTLEVRSELEVAAALRLERKGVGHVRYTDGEWLFAVVERS